MDLLEENLIQNTYDDTFSKDKSASMNSKKEEVNIFTESREFSNNVFEKNKVTFENENDDSFRNSDSF